MIVMSLAIAVPYSPALFGSRAVQLSYQLIHSPVKTKKNKWLSRYFNVSKKINECGRERKINNPSKIFKISKWYGGGNLSICILLDYSCY